MAMPKIQRPETWALYIFSSSVPAFPLHRYHISVGVVPTISAEAGPPYRRTHL